MSYSGVSLALPEIPYPAQTLGRGRSVEKVGFRHRSCHELKGFACLMGVSVCLHISCVVQTAPLTMKPRHDCEWGGESVSAVCTLCYGFEQKRTS
jgi:hypothetical protein